MKHVAMINTKYMYGRIYIIIYDMVEAIFIYFIHQILVDSF